MSSIYKKIVGIIVPSAGIATEAAYHHYTPEDVAVVTARTKFNHITYQELAQMINLVKFAAEDICRTDPDVIMFGSLTASCISGDAIRNIVEQHTGIPCITAFESLLRVIEQFGFKRIAIISPFSDELSLLIKANLLNHGVEECQLHSVTQPDGAPFQSIRALEEIDSSILFDMAKSIDLSGMDALLFGFSGLQVMDRIRDLERDIGMPVLCGDQFTIWNALRTIDFTCHIPELGHIFSEWREN